jgi:hypothetical protein
MMRTLEGSLKGIGKVGIQGGLKGRGRVGSVAG